MSLSYIIIVNDNGELKSIHQMEVFNYTTKDEDILETINSILDRRSKLEKLNDEFQPKRKQRNANSK